MNDLCCCLADFGLSLLAESQTLNSSSRMSKGSIRWLAPEYIDPKAVIDRAYIAARDIYAYGCTVVEVGSAAYRATLSHSFKIFTGKPPFSGIKNEAAVIHMVMTGNFPPRPQYLLQDGLWSLVVACLTASPSQRPIAEQIPKVLAGEIKPCQESMKEGNITMYVLSLILSLERIRLLISLPVRPGIMILVQHCSVPGTFLIHDYPLLKPLMFT